MDLSGNATAICAGGSAADGVRSTRQLPRIILQLKLVHTRIGYQVAYCHPIALHHGQLYLCCCAAAAAAAAQVADLDEQLRQLKADRVVESVVEPDGKRGRYTGQTQVQSTASHHAVTGVDRFCSFNHPDNHSLLRSVS